jgi:hypothetical protein
MIKTANINFDHNNRFSSFNIIYLIRLNVALTD